MRFLKLIALSILFFHLIGIFSFKISKSIYAIRGNFAFAQEAEQKGKEPEKPKKEAAEGENTANKKGEALKEGAEKTKKKIKLPKQNATINPETFRIMEMVEKKKKELESREKE